MSQTQLRELKTTLRAYLRRYPLDRLCMLLAHAQSGKLAYGSCCCFIGVETADHALLGECVLSEYTHYMRAWSLPGAPEAEQAYAALGSLWDSYSADRDRLRQRRIIPMIRAELRRRECIAIPVEETASVA